MTMHAQQPDQSARPTPRRSHGRRGFTLLEVLLVGVIITILTALLFVAVSAAIKASRRAAEEQYLRNLATGVKQFKDAFGYYPPLVADGASSNDGPINVTLKRVRVKGQNLADPDQNPADAGRFLRYEINADNGATVTRGSVYSLPYYILGTLGHEYDGLDGPGYMKPDADGKFAKAGTTTKPYFDMATGTERLKTGTLVAGEDDEAARKYLADRWGNPVRYYRWQALRHVNGATIPGSVYPGATGNDASRKGEVRSFNVPKIVGDPMKDLTLRTREFAIVSAGPDGQIDELNPDADVNKDNIVEVGP